MIIALENGMLLSSVYKFLFFLQVQVELPGKINIGCPIKFEISKIEICLVLCIFIW